MNDSNAARTNLVYLPCCFGEFSECRDKGKGCIHKNNCRADENSEMYPIPSNGSLICTFADCPERKEKILHLTNCSNSRKVFFKGTEDQSICAIAKEYGHCSDRCVYLIAIGRCPRGFQR
jgi:hypothetical protein